MDRIRRSGHLVGSVPAGDLAYAIEGDGNVGFCGHPIGLDINGDGQQEIVLAHARAICDGRGHRLAAFAPDAEFERVAAPGAGDSGPYALVGDMTGNGAADIVVHTERKALVYENSHGPAEPGAEVGSGSNFTLY